MVISKVKFYTKFYLLKKKSKNDLPKVFIPFDQIFYRKINNIHQIKSSGRNVIQRKKIKINIIKPRDLLFYSEPKMFYFIFTTKQLIVQ